MNHQTRGNAGNDKKWLQSTGYIFLIAICEKIHLLVAIFYSDYKILPNNICEKGIWLYASTNSSFQQN